jgi:hypothetical protein
MYISAVNVFTYGQIARSNVAWSLVLCQLGFQFAISAASNFVFYVVFNYMKLEGD